MSKEYAKLQFEASKMYAMYWHAQAVTGAAANRDIECAGKQLTDEAKVKDALDTMLRHIHRMNELAEYICSE